MMLMNSAGSNTWSDRTQQDHSNIVTNTTGSFILQDRSNIVTKYNSVVNSYEPGSFILHLAEYSK